MSVVEKLSNLFSRKSEEPQADPSGELSLGMPDPSMDPADARSAEAAIPMAMAPVDPDSVADESMSPADAAEEADLISVPLLGRRSVVTHQRVLFTMLALSLLVLGGVAVFAV